MPRLLRKSRIDFGGFLRDAGERGDFLRGGGLDAGDAAEFFQQALFLGGRDAGAFVEQALAHAAAVEQFVVAVGEAVGLVADALEQLERAAVVRQADRLASAGNEDFLMLLGEADDRQVVQAERAQFLHSHAELALAAIDDDEIRQDDFRAALAGEPALDLDGIFLRVRRIRIGGGVF